MKKIIFSIVLVLIMKDIMNSNNNNKYEEFFSSEPLNAEMLLEMSREDIASHYKQYIKYLPMKIKKDNENLKDAKSYRYNDYVESNLKDLYEVKDICTKQGLPDILSMRQIDQNGFLEHTCDSIIRSIYNDPLKSYDAVLHSDSKWSYNTSHFHHFLRYEQRKRYGIVLFCCIEYAKRSHSLSILRSEAMHEMENIRNVMDDIKKFIIDLSAPNGILERKINFFVDSCRRMGILLQDELLQNLHEMVKEEESVLLATIREEEQRLQSMIKSEKSEFASMFDDICNNKINFIFDLSWRLSKKIAALSVVLYCGKEIFYSCIYYYNFYIKQKTRKMETVKLDHIMTKKKNKFMVTNIGLAKNIFYLVMTCSSIWYLNKD